MTCDIRSNVPGSRPFVALTSVAVGLTYGAAARMTDRQPCEGVAETTIAASMSASSIDAVASTEGGNGTPGT